MEPNELENKVAATVASAVSGVAVPPSTSEGTKERAETDDEKYFIRRVSESVTKAVLDALKPVVSDESESDEDSEDEPSKPRRRKPPTKAAPKPAPKKSYFSALIGR
jgi:hypothetical protein